MVGNADYVPLQDGEDFGPHELRKWKPPWACGLGQLLALKTKATTSFARFTSSGLPLIIKVAIPALNYAADPILKLVIVKNFTMPLRDPYWASACIFCSIMPFFIIYLFYNHIGSANEIVKRKERFTEAFGRSPSVQQIFALHLYVIYAQIRNIFVTSDKFGLREQCYAKVELLVTGACGGTSWVLFQVYIFIRQRYLTPPREVVKPETLLISLVSCLANQYLAFSYLRDYAKLSHEGNYVSFFNNLLTLGEGMAPPIMLSMLRTQKNVKVQGDLSGLTARGIISLARCMSSSVTLESAHFHDTGIKAPDKFEFVLFPDEFSFNRHILAVVTFEPKVPVPVSHWGGFDYALRFRELRNGDQIVFERKVTDDKVRLMDAIEGGNLTALKEEINKMDLEGNQASGIHEAALWSSRLGNWKCLAELLAVLPPQQKTQKFMSNMMTKTAEEGRIDCMRLLLKCKGSLVRVRGEGYSPLMSAACCGHEPAVRFLLEVQADANEDVGGCSVLHQSTFIDSPGIIAALLDAKAAIDPVYRGKTPLGRAVQQGCIGQLGVLIERKANLNGDADHVSPLVLAVVSGQVESAKLLLKAGAQPLTTAVVEQKAPDEMMKAEFLLFATS